MVRGTNEQWLGIEKVIVRATMRALKKRAARTKEVGRERPTLT
jgi:hypothetical protein